MTRPNIVYIHSHDTGRYIQPYGYAIDTPNLQRLAEQGVLFRQAFCAAPTCSPSRACLLTGQSAHSNGMLGLAHRGHRLHDYHQHIVHTLRDAAGYHSALCGVQHIANDMPNGARDIGYDQVLDVPGTRASDVGRVAANWLAEAPDKPFFLSVGFFETHRRFPHAMPADDPRYVRPPAPLPDTPANRQDMADYCTMARQLDMGVGQVLAALDQHGLAENTLVIATTDHGIAFPAMKCNLTDHGMGIMLIMRGPGGFDSGKCIDGMVSHIDLFPTICELLDITKPDWLEGRSIMPLIRGETDQVNEQVFGEVTYHASYEPKRAVRTERYKYIRRLDDRDRPTLPNCDAGLSKTTWLDHGWADRPMPREYLFDLAFDPNESNNLAESADYADALADMRRRLDDWMQRTNDPLLDPNFQHPDGLTLNPTDGLDPGDGSTFVT